MDSRSELSPPDRGRGAQTFPRQPWWRVGIVWMVIGGPLAVVVASVATAIIAASGADELVTETRSKAVPAAPSAPALQARNHAATPAR